MERRSDPIDCEGKNRIGHEFYSCQFEPFNETGFSRWGVKGGPQGLKPVSHARFDGTTTSRALPVVVLAQCNGGFVQPQTPGLSTTRTDSQASRFASLEMTFLGGGPEQCLFGAA